MFGLSPLILLVGGGGLLALLAGGGWWAYDNGKDAKAKELAPVIEKWQGRALKAEEINDGLRKVQDEIDAKIRTCNERADELSKRTPATRGEIAAATLAANQKIRVLEAELNRARGQLATSKSPELKCAAASNILNELAERNRHDLGLDSPPAGEAK